MLTWAQCLLLLFYKEKKTMIKDGSTLKKFSSYDLLLFLAKIYTTKQKYVSQINLSFGWDEPDFSN